MGLDLGLVVGSAVARAAHAIAEHVAAGASAAPSPPTGTTTTTTPAPEPHDTPATTRDARTGQQTLDMIERRFHKQETGIGAWLGEHVLGNDRRDYYADRDSNTDQAAAWPLGQLLAAQLDVSAGSTGTDANQKVREQADHVIDILDQRYGRTNDKGFGYAAGEHDGSSDRYYDDNAWIALDLMQAYRQTGDQKYLDKVKSLVPFLESGLYADGSLHWREDQDPSHDGVKPGHSLPATGPTIEVLTQLYGATHDSAYLDSAKKAYAWVKDNMRDSDGLYIDTIPDREAWKDGVTQATFTYNQGTMIGAGTLLYQATGDASYLDDAKQTAKASVERFGGDPGGDITKTDLWTSAPAFNGIFFKNLAMLDAVAPDPSYTRLRDRYLDGLERVAKDRESGVYWRGGLGAYENEGETHHPESLLDQSAIAQVQALAALTPDEVRRSLLIDH